MSKWLYNAVQSKEVLTINRDYFRLSGGLERRLYELARKHCGHQPEWSVSIDTLQPGTEVTVSYEEQNGEAVITDVVPVQQ